MSRVFTMEEVARLSSSGGSALVVVDGLVLDVSKFARFHPGGTKMLLDEAGKDVSQLFWEFHAAEILDKYREKLVVGTVGAPRPPRAVEHPDGRFGDLVPYGDPAWYQGASSPYYKDTHRRFRARVRAFVDKELRPYVRQWDEAGTYPPELHRKAYEAGIYAAIYPAAYGGTPPDDFDAFHKLILTDELARAGAGGVLWSCFWCFGIAVPPLLEAGSEYLKDLVLREVIEGRAIMSLAVSEPWVGSDVASLRTTAVRDGDHYVVNGAKKWITGGMKAKYYTVAVRTGGAGVGGVSALLVPRETPGVKTRRMKTQGWLSSNTAYITFEDVRVPVRNLIGAENKGFKVIMSNFNSERMVLGISSVRYARTMLEDAIVYARSRKTFGKRLVDHQAIRFKVAEMAKRVESAFGMAESLTYRVQQGDPDMGGAIALFKVVATQCMDFCAREASQIFGGNSCIREGRGARVERLYREVRTNAVGGGSEEILTDLAMRRAKL